MKKCLMISLLKFNLMNWLKLSAGMMRWKTLVICMKKNNLAPSSNWSVTTAFHAVNGSSSLPGVTIWLLQSLRLRLA